MRPRIVHVIPTLHWGSAESQLLAIAYLLGDRAETHICTTSVSQPFRTRAELYGATIHAIRPSRCTKSLEFRHLLQTLWRLRPDILHLWRVEDEEYLASVVPFVAGTRLLIDQRQPRHAPKVGVQCGKALLGLAARAIYSESNVASVVYQDFVADMGEADGSQAHADSSHRLHDRLAIPLSKKIVAVAGWLHRGKRIEDIIWAIDLLQIVRNDVHLVILGYGPDEGRLRDWVQRTQTEGHVHFVPDVDLLWDLWSEISAVVFASECGDPPLALAEAMLHQVPVLVSRIPAHEQFVGKFSPSASQNGLFFEVGDRAEIARGIEQVIDFPVESLARAVRAKQHLQETQAIVPLAKIDPLQRVPAAFQRSDGGPKYIRQLYERYGIDA
jgi:glycosyltransferase involved in cell wall biosynthesis